MTRDRWVTGSFGNLSQKNDVQNGSVAGVATVAGFFLSTRKRREKKENGKAQRGSLFKSAATPATVATALCWRGFSRGRFAGEVATNLPQPVTAPEVTSCP